MSERLDLSPTVRRKRAVLDAGLYIVRYDVGAPGATAEVSLAQPLAAGVSWVPEPGTDGALSRPGDFAVLRCDGRAEVEFHLRPRGGEARASISLLKIHRAQVAALVDAGPEAFEDHAPEPAHDPYSDGTSGEPVVGLALLAHVATLGDVVVGSGEWVGGPNWDLPVEGIQVRWMGRPEGVRLRYAALAGPNGERRVEGRGEAGFAGSRGRAAPLAGVELALEGPGAGTYSLVAEARFERGAPATFRGTDLRVLSPRPGQRLTGLKLGILRVEAPSRAPQPAPARAEAPEPRRVRVFRSVGA